MYEFKNHECAIAIRYGEGTPPDIRNLPCYPEEVNSSVQSSWSEMSIIGRVGSLEAYTGTSDVSSSFSFDLHREMTMYNGGTVNAGDNQIDALIRFIKSGCYPMYGTNVLLPPRVLWKFGDMYISGILKSVSESWKLPIIDGAYSICTLSIEMTSADKRIISYSDVRNSSVLGTRGHGLSDDKWI